jgi:hypothetical protein
MKMLKAVKSSGPSCNPSPLRRLRQKGLKFKASLNDIVRQSQKRGGEPVIQVVEKS